MVDGPCPVFLSWTGDEAKQAAAELQVELADIGVGSFCSLRDLKPGDPSIDIMLNAVADASVVVLFLSETFFLSRFCRFEFDIARAPIQLYGETKETLGGLLVVRPAIGNDYGVDFLPTQLRGNKNALRADRIQPLADHIARELAVRGDLSTRSLLGSFLANLLVARYCSEAHMPPRRRYAQDRRYAVTDYQTSTEFHGRARFLSDMLTMLVKHDGPGMVWLFGGGGMGKTRLAQEFVWRLGPKNFPGGVFWIDASIGSMDFHVDGLLRWLREDPVLLIQSGQGLEARKETLQKILAERHGMLGPALWIIDNLPDLIEGQVPDVKNYVPLDLPLGVIVTSRCQGPHHQLEVEVPELTEGEAWLLLTQGLALDMIPPPNEIKQSCELVGNHPLALTLLNALLGGRGPFSLAKFNRDCQEGGPVKVTDEALEVLRLQLPPGTVRAIAEVLWLTVDQLSPRAQSMAISLSFCGSEPIPMALVESMGIGKTAAWELVRRSVVRPVSRLESGGETEWYGTMHPLLADYLRGLDHRTACLSSMLVSAKGIIGQLSGDSPRDWPMFAALAPHVLSLLKHLWTRVEVDGDA